MKGKCARLTRSKRSTRDVDSPLNIPPRCSLCPIEHSTLRFSIPGFFPHLWCISDALVSESSRGIAKMRASRNRASNEPPRIQMGEGWEGESGNRAIINGVWRLGMRDALSFAMFFKRLSS